MTTNSTDRPNILLVMFDQMAALSLPMYGYKLVKVPHLQALADNGAVFENAYCNVPLCSPSRFVMMTGKLASRIGAYDNASELPSSIPTFAHYLRSMGYRTVLSGKMDFTGADQLHGYEERLTTDLSPSDFGWTPNWEEPKWEPWFHDLSSVVDAGAYDHSLSMDYDEDVSNQAIRWLYEAAGSADQRPFMMTVSYMHPHDPYLAKRAFWDLYKDEDIDLPAVPFIPPAERDPHGRRLYEMYDRGEYDLTEERLRAARRGYYGMISYIDDQMGRVLDVLDRTGQRDNTVVIATADHGDMLGERGLWFKMTFFERAVRIPMIISAPKWFGARRVAQPVSLVDMLPTMLDIASRNNGTGIASSIDGNSLLPLALGKSSNGSDGVYGEFMGEGTTQPIFMIRRGSHKYISCQGDPPQLYDLAADGREVTNCAGAADYAAIEKAFAAEVAEKWDSASLREDIINSQRSRRLIADALIKGRIHPWDYAPRVDAANQYFRNYGEMRSDRPFRVPAKPAPVQDGRGRAK